MWAVSIKDKIIESIIAWLNVGFNQRCWIDHYCLNCVILSCHHHNHDHGDFDDHHHIKLSSWWWSARVGSGPSETKQWADMIAKPKQAAVVWHRWIDCCRLDLDGDEDDHRDDGEDEDGELDEDGRYDRQAETVVWHRSAFTLIVVMVMMVVAGVNICGRCEYLSKKLMDFLKSA